MVGSYEWAKSCRAGMWYRRSWGWMATFSIAPPRAEWLLSPVDGAWGPKAACSGLSQFGDLRLYDSMDKMSGCTLSPVTQRSIRNTGLLLLPPPTSPQARKGQASPVVSDRCFDVWSLGRLKTNVSAQGRRQPQLSLQPLPPFQDSVPDTRASTVPQKLSPVWHAGKSAQARGAVQKSTN